ncbi:tyrosine recombinase XerD [Terasakiella brassicae]|uniref:Tyrosine recombinase XerD n=1 Tax=Terasakiella brassicae TaxID=1634917 RepID=A0A917FHB5_9PROT|nr:tyrosine-type recombinase/integrase [Terasakiella brassicae]GGF76092.1 tyrosine recombinase XerD [Terasakiella brassicae]
MLDNLFHRQSLEDLFIDYIEQVKIERGLSPKTIQSYRESLSLFGAFVNTDHMSLRYWTLDYLRPFFHHGRNDRCWAARTYHIHHNNLKKFGDWLLLTKHTRHNPLIAIQKPKLAMVKKKGLNVEEVHKLLYVALLKSSALPFLRIRNHALISLALQTGLRMSEIINLRIHDLHFQDHHLHVRSGKGGKDRFVSITNDLQSTLEVYLKEHEKFFQMKTLILFPSKSGKLFAVREFRRLTDRLGKLADIIFSSHDLRRTYASTLSKQGVSAFVIQEQLGHSDIRVTMRYVSFEQKNKDDILKDIHLYN